MVDYTKTVIYTIRCIDKNITDLYVGSTCNFISRKTQHKSRCNTENRHGYNYHIYKVIRANGGWDNWIMTPYEEYKECTSILQCRIREEHVRRGLNANLNTHQAYSTIDEKREQINLNNSVYNANPIICPCGKYYTYRNKIRHMNTKQHCQFLLNNPTVII